MTAQIPGAGPTGSNPGAAAPLSSLPLHSSVTCVCVGGMPQECEGASGSTQGACSVPPILAPACRGSRGGHAAGRRCDGPALAEPDGPCVCGPQLLGCLTASASLICGTKHLDGVGLLADLDWDGGVRVGIVREPGRSLHGIVVIVSTFPWVPGCDRAMTRTESEAFVRTHLLGGAPALGCSAPSLTVRRVGKTAGTLVRLALRGAQKRRVGGSGPRSARRGCIEVHVGHAAVGAPPLVNMTSCVGPRSLQRATSPLSGRPHHPRCSRGNW